SFSPTSIPLAHLGIVRDNEVLYVDLASQALTLIGPDQMLDLLEHYGERKPILQAIFNRVADRRFSEVKIFSAIGAVHTLSEVQLVAPIPRPRKNIMCLGLNYADHAKESAAARGREGSLPEYPVIVTKAP